MTTIFASRTIGTQSSGFSLFSALAVTPRPRGSCRSRKQAQVDGRESTKWGAEQGHVDQCRRRDSCERGRRAASLSGVGHRRWSRFSCRNDVPTVLALAANPSDRGLDAIARFRNERRCQWSVLAGKHENSGSKGNDSSRTRPPSYCRILQHGQRFARDGDDSRRSVGNTWNDQGCSSERRSVN